VNPITHFLVGWVALETRVVATRDKALVCLAGVASDLDGLGIIVDFATRTLGLAPTSYYQDWHRMLGHGLPAALAITLLVAACARDRLRGAALAFVAVHLHILCDVLGSRGTTTEDLWPIHYLEPVAAGLDAVWSGQWPLVGWQNTLITAALLGVTMWRAAARGYSPVGLASPRADDVFVAVIRKWRGRLRGPRARE
jgi:inner membrane protein